MKSRFGGFLTALISALLAVAFLATPATAEGHVFRHSDTCSNSFVQVTYQYVHWITKKDGPDIVEPLWVTVTASPKNGADLKSVVIDPKGGSFEQRNLGDGRQQLTIVFSPSLNAETHHTRSKVLYSHEDYYDGPSLGKCTSTS